MRRSACSLAADLAPPTAHSASGASTVNVKSSPRRDATCTPPTTSRAEGGAETGEGDTGRRGASNQPKVARVNQEQGPVGPTMCAWGSVAARLSCARALTTAKLRIRCPSARVNTYSRENTLELPPPPASSWAATSLAVRPLPGGAITCDAGV